MDYNVNSYKHENAVTRKSKLKLTSDLFYGIVLWVLLIYGGGYLSYVEPLNIILPIVSFVALLIHFIYKHIRISPKELCMLFFIFVYIMLLYIYHSYLGASFSTYANIVLSIGAVFIFNKLLNDRNKFIALFEKVMLFICIYSCICFTLNLIFNFTASTPMLGSLYKLWMGQNIKIYSRNSGPFWEPGIFQIYIVIALYFSLFYFKNKNGKFPLFYVIVFGVTILTTISTTGYLIMGVLLLWKYVSISRSTKTKQLKLAVLFLIPVVFISVITVILSTPAVADKFQANNGSFNIRSYEVAEAIPIIRDSGMFGKGANTLARRTLMINHGIGGNGDTNSVGYSSVASMYGWVTLLLSMLRILFSCRNNFREQWVLLYGIMLITWTTGAVMTIPLYYFFLIGFNRDSLHHSAENDEDAIGKEPSNSKFLHIGYKNEH